MQKPSKLPERSEIIDLEGTVIDGNTSWLFKIAGQQTISILVYFRQFQFQKYLPIQAEQLEFSNEPKGILQAGKTAPKGKIINRTKNKLTMGKLKYLVIHCTATPEGREVTKDNIIRWHTSPKHKGGRGWRRPGYSDIIYLDGSLVNILPFNQDDEVDSWEISNEPEASMEYPVMWCMPVG